MADEPVPHHHIVRPCREGEPIPDIMAVHVPVKVPGMVTEEHTIEIHGEPVVLERRVMGLVDGVEVQLIPVMRPARRVGEIFITEQVPLTAEELQARATAREWHRVKRGSIGQILKLEETGMHRLQREYILASGLAADHPVRQRAQEVEDACVAIRETPEFQAWLARSTQERIEGEAYQAAHRAAQELAAADPETTIPEGASR
jgi:hypothetical protein